MRDYIRKAVITACVSVAAVFAANAQYYQLANQASSMLQAALTGGFNYRGMVDVSYLGGIGDKNASFLELSTTQGFKYANWFYMGVGAGIDLMNTTVNDDSYRPSLSKNYTTSAAMVPLYTDFRFNIGEPTKVGAFIDVRVGAAFYISNSYIQVGDGYINSSESFYLRPTVGMRIPVSKSNPKLAVNLGASYQLLTNSYWYNPNGSNSITLNSLGLNVGFEW